MSKARTEPNTLWLRIVVSVCVLRVCMGFGAGGRGAGGGKARTGGKKGGKKTYENRGLQPKLKTSPGSPL